MLNNKGQSLVLFILMIPILLGILALVIDVGNVIYQKNEIDNMILFVLDYGLNLQLEKENETTDIPVKLEEVSILSDDATDLENDERLTSSTEGGIDLTDAELEQLQKLLDYNLENGNHEVSIENNCIVIISQNEVSGFFSHIFEFKQFKIESKYRGYLDGEKKNIQKEE